MVSKALNLPMTQKNRLMFKTKSDENVPSSLESLSDFFCQILELTLQIITG